MWKLGQQNYGSGGFLRKMLEIEPDGRNRVTVINSFGKREEEKQNLKKKKGGGGVSLVDVEDRKLKEGVKR